MNSDEESKLAMALAMLVRAIQHAPSKAALESARQYAAAVAVAWEDDGDVHGALAKWQAVAPVGTGVPVLPAKPPPVDWAVKNNTRICNIFEQRRRGLTLTAIGANEGVGHGAIARMIRKALRRARYHGFSVEDDAMKAWMSGEILRLTTSNTPADSPPS